MRYAVRIRKDTNGTFLVTVPDLPEAITFGETTEEARLQAVDAIETAMMARMADREAIPLPKSVGRVSVVMKPAVAAKVALWNAMVDKRMGKAVLARKLNWHLPQVDRVLDVRHESKLASLVDALQATGNRLEINVLSANKNRRVSIHRRAA